MSLFQARDWWTASIDKNEEFGYGSMCVGNVDNGVDGKGTLSYTAAHRAPLF